MSTEPKVTIKLPLTKIHNDTATLAAELIKIIPDSAIVTEHPGNTITVDIVQDVRPQYIVIRSENTQLVLKICGYRSTKSLRLKKEIITPDYPQLVLKGFETDVGIRVAKVLMSLFPINLDSKQVANFAVNDGFLFFRMYLYCFSARGPVLEKIGPHIDMRVWRIVEYDNGNKVVRDFTDYFKTKCVL